MASVDSNSSLLIPPNPSLSPTKPSASILLNGTGRPATATTSIKLSSPPRTTTPLPQTSVFNSYPLSPSTSSTSNTASSSTSTNVPPASPSYSLSRSSSASSTSLRPALDSRRRLSTPKISFAPLPTIPNELKRRNSISIGVASRKHLIGAGAGGSGNMKTNSNKVMMTDEDWENYKKHYDEKNGNDPIDLGAVAKQGAKALWGKVKRNRSSSQSSQSSITSSTSTNSASTSNLASSSSTPALSGSLTNLRTVEEDEEHHEPIPIGRRRSPSPKKGGLHTIPGSPPPGTRDSDIESSPSTTTSAISDTDSDFGETEAETEEDEPERPITHPSYTPGNRIAAAEASSSMKNRLLDLEGSGSNDEDGDATPRRLPSPPPRKADVQPLPEGDDEDEYEDMDVDGRSTPGGYGQRESQWEKEHREKKGRTEILGFDPERFGRALDLATKNGEIERR